MEQEKYRVNLIGYKNGKGEYYIEKDFGEFFNISHEEAKSYFKNLPYTFKENLTLDEANQYEKDFWSIGAKCEIENMKFKLSGLSLE